MESILNIVTAAVRPRFATLTRVKQELSITDGASNEILTAKIEEATSDLILAIGYGVVSEEVTETFWHDHPQRFGYGYGWTSGTRNNEVLFLRRTPVSAVASVTLDDVLIDPSEYRLDGEIGRLFRLDSSGYPSEWIFCKSLIVAYTGGYVLPGASGANLPPTYEGAAVDLVKSFWAARGRDPLVKSEELPGVRRVDYWVGATGDPDQLPPEVRAKLALVRRPRMAVA